MDIFFLACQVPGVPARPEEDRESEENPEGSGADSEASGGILTADAFLSFSLSLFAAFCLSWLLFFLLVGCLFVVLLGIFSIRFPNVEKLVKDKKIKSYQTSHSIDKLK